MSSPSKQFAILLAVLALLTGCSGKAPSPSPAAIESDIAAKEVLDKMRAVYRQAKSYTDNSTIVEYSVARVRGVETELPYHQLSVAFERPNKICVTYADAVEGFERKTEYKVAANGTVIRSSANEVPLQIHEAIAPRTLTAKNFIPEPLLRAELLQVSLENIFPQIAMLLSEDAQQPIFPNDHQRRLLTDAELGGKPYHRVQMASPAGKRVLWIDQKSYFLRRMELPIDERRQSIDPNKELSSLSICLDFEDVTFDAGIHENSFELEIPTGGRRVRRFVSPPPPAPTSAGTDAEDEALAEHGKLVQRYEQALASATIRDSILEVEFARPEVGPQNLPETWQAERIWQTLTSDVSRPGDVVLSGESGHAFVLDGGQAILELDATGSVLGRHLLPVHRESTGGFLRTSVDSQGKSWHLASGVGWQQVYLFDDAWKNVLSFPDRKHSGIGDVYLADLTGTGKPIMHVGYWGGLGIQGGALDGRRLFANRSLDHVLQITSGPADSEGKPTLWCTSTRGTILELSPAGKTSHELYVVGQALMAVARHPAEDMHCGLAIKELGWYSAVGFSADGTKLWDYQLPPGEYVVQVPRIQFVEFPGGEQGWLVAAANGSLHWLDEEGNLVERFDYGELITGVAMGTDKNGTVLLVSTKKNLTAWSLNP